MCMFCDSVAYSRVNSHTEHWVFGAGQRMHEHVRVLSGYIRLNRQIYPLAERFEREEEVTIQESSNEVKESNEEVYWSGDGKENH